MFMVDISTILFLNTCHRVARFVILYSRWVDLSSRTALEVLVPRRYINMRLSMYYQALLYLNIEVGNRCLHVKLDCGNRWMLIMSASSKIRGQYCKLFCQICIPDLSIPNFVCSSRALLESSASRWVGFSPCMAISS
jgi:hypothetical protein